MENDRKKKGNGNESKSQWIFGQKLQESHSGVPATRPFSSQRLRQTFLSPVDPTEEEKCFLQR
jgi:hypothetical protein